MLFATPYAPPLADPDGSGALLAAVDWLQGTLLGTVATTIAVIAVASMGFLMLAERIDWRRGATVIIGCFVLFGATSIVAGVRGAAGDEAESPPIHTFIASPVAKPSPAPATPYDPYAGAAVRP